MTALGYLNAKEIQLKTMSRIMGGQDFIAIAPEGSGKTTSYVLGVLNRLKYAEPEAPSVLILAPTQERIQAIIDHFYLISQNKSLSIKGLRTGGSMEEEIEDLVAGVEIVVATPNRARSVYLKLGLNLNKLQTFIIDQAEEIIKEGMIQPVRELAQSSQKCQKLVFSTVEHEKLHHMVDEFMEFAPVIEVEELAEEALALNPMMLYKVPNFTTKINLLNYLLSDDEVFDKAVVFVNSRLTAQKLSRSIHKSYKEEVAQLDPIFFEDYGFQTIAEFKEQAETRILIVANEGTALLDLTGIPFIFHFELPENKETLLHRIVKREGHELLGFTFATDLELPDVKRIEQTAGQKMQDMELPDDLVIYQGKKQNATSEDQAAYDESRGGAFHKKKEANSKTYNYGGGKKAKMTMKKKKGIV